MPILIKQLEANILDNFSSEVNMISISAISGTDGYFKIFGLEGFLQDFTKVVESEEYILPNEYGLKVNKNNTFELLEISY